MKAKVPRYQFPGGRAQLQCDYDLGNDSLYALKWYKEHEEFYRFVPKAVPQVNSYNVDGVNVNVSFCSVRLYLELSNNGIKEKTSYVFYFFKNSLYHSINYSMKILAGTCKALSVSFIIACFFVFYSL